MMGRATSPTFSQRFLERAGAICGLLDHQAIEQAVLALAASRDAGGRLFILGVGGSAANASHAVNDFRKLCGFEAYAPTDNVSELTARTNDDGWASVFSEWLRLSRLSSRDAVLVLSVGGGNAEKNVSPNLVSALDVARTAGATIVGIVGRDGGYAAKVATVCILVPTVAAELVTPFAEAFQGIVWHCMVSHPALKKHATKWESIG
jgi:D-sedoheptulose 7-phosphate isomerase